MNNSKNIVIVGAGITGLSAAYYLQKAIKDKNLPYKVMLIEASDRLGGKIKTIKKNGYTIEQGADSFLGRKKPAVKLVEELGMTDQLVRNDVGQAYVHIQNKLHKIPQGFFMGIPTRLTPLVATELFSIKGKLRAGLDLVLPKGKEVSDQSLGSFFRHRFGNELVENLIEPLLSGIYSGDIDQMSLMATFPNFYELGQEHRSLIKGLKRTMPRKKRNTGRREGQFFSFKNGFQSMVDILEERLLGVTILRNKAVKQISKKENDYQIILSNGEVHIADTIIMATPHSILPKVFSEFDIFNTFNDIPVTSVANVALAFDQSAIKKKINGTGFLVSRNSDYRITACTWTHKKWPQTTPDGKILLRAYVGKPNDQAVVDLSDKEITEIVLNDLTKSMQITLKPEFTVVTRWKSLMPQYIVGHKERIHKVRKQITDQLPGIFLCGSSFEGVGVPDCIEQGEKTVAHVLEYLFKK